MSSLFHSRCHRLTSNSGLDSWLARGEFREGPVCKTLSTPPMHFTFASQSSWASPAPITPRAEQCRRIGTWPKRTYSWSTVYSLS